MVSFTNRHVVNHYHFRIHIKEVTFLLCVLLWIKAPAKCKSKSRLKQVIVECETFSY